MTLAFSIRRGYGTLLVGTAATATLADWFFYKHIAGWTAAAFATWVLCFLSLRGTRFLRSRPGIIATVGILGLLFALVEQPDVLPVLMTFAGLCVLAILNSSSWRPGTSFWVGRFIELGSIGLLRPLIDNRLAAKWARRHPGGLRGSGRQLSLWIIPCILSIGFVGLFALANPVVSRWVGRLYDFFADWAATWDRFLNVNRIIFWLVAATLVYAMFRARSRIRRRREPEWIIKPRPDVEAGVTARGHAIVVRCLVVFNVVFLGQNALDALYLFGGATLPDGMTYAQYAHRGAYPLVATALLAALFVLVTFRPGGAAESSTLARRLVYLWLAQNVMLTLSAAWRLDLYVDAYTLTRLRLAAAVWMLLVVTGLVWVVARIALRKGNAWLLDRNVVTTCLVLYACCFINTSGLIANFNARHCQEAGGAGPPIDVEYLYSLGPEALPALSRVAPLLQNAARQNDARDAIDCLKLDLQADLSDWRGWTLRRARLAKAAGLPDGYAGAVGPRRVPAWRSRHEYRSRGDIDWQSPQDWQPR